MRDSSNLNETTKRIAPLWLTAAIIILLAGAVLWLYGRVNMLESRLSSIEAGSLSQLSITISSLDREQGRPGQYFQFDATQLDELFDEDAWSGRKFVAVVPRQGVVEPVRLWLKETDGRIGFGRTERDLPALSWIVGQNLIILY